MDQNHEASELHHSSTSSFILPHSTALSAARSALHTALPKTGIGLDATRLHLQDQILPALTNSNKSGHFYGLVTGGSTLIESFRTGRWWSAAHVPGCVGLTAPGERARLRWRGTRTRSAGPSGRSCPPEVGRSASLVAQRSRASPCSAPPARSSAIGARRSTRQTPCVSRRCSEQARCR